MKFALISDTHGWLPSVSALQGADVLIHAGDIGPDYNVEDWIVKQWEPWRERVENELDCRVLPTFGNHDFPDKWAGRKLTIYHDEIVRIGGKKIWFSPWSTELPGWAWQKSEPELFDILSTIPKDVDWIVSHTPPFGLLDKLAWTGKSVGAKSLRVIMGELPQLTHVICGHIHEGRGIHRWTPDGQSREIAVMNVACVDEHYELLSRPITWMDVDE